MTRAVLDKLYNTSVCSHSASLENEDAESLLAECAETDTTLLQISLIRSFFPLKQEQLATASCINSTRVSFLRQYLLLNKPRLMHYLLTLLNCDRILISFCASKAFVKVFLSIDSPMEEWLHRLLSQLSAAPHVVAYSLQSMEEIFKALRKAQTTPLFNRRALKVCVKVLCMRWANLLKALQACACGKLNQPNLHTPCSGVLEFFTLTHEILRHREASGGAEVGTLASEDASKRPVNNAASVSMTTTGAHIPPESHRSKPGELYQGISCDTFEHPSDPLEEPVGPTDRGSGSNLHKRDPLVTYLPGDSVCKGQDPAMCQAQSVAALHAVIMDNVEGMVDLVLRHQSALILARLFDVTLKLLQVDDMKLCVKLGRCVGTLIQSTVVKEVIGQAWRPQTAHGGNKAVSPAVEVTSVPQTSSSGGHSCVLSIALRKMVVLSLHYTKVLLQKNDRQQIVELWQPLQDGLGGCPGEEVCNAQGALFEVLSDQDDCLVKGLMACTHIRRLARSMEGDIYGQDRLKVVLRMVDVHSLVVLFLSSVSFDHGALLDFLMSEETPFLGFLVEYLQLVASDWGGLCGACEIQEVILIDQDAVESPSEAQCRDKGSMESPSEAQCRDKGSMESPSEAQCRDKGSMESPSEAQCRDKGSMESPSEAQCRDKGSMESPSEAQCRDKGSMESPSEAQCRDGGPSEAQCRDGSPFEAQCRDGGPSEAQCRDGGPSEAQCRDGRTVESPSDVCYGDEDSPTERAKRIKLSVNDDWSPCYFSPYGRPEGMEILDSVIGMFIRLKYALLRLDSKRLLPPKLDQLIPLLECVEDLYEAI